MQLAAFMEKLTDYPSAQKDAQEMVRVANWFNDQAQQEKGLVSGTACLMNAVARGQLEMVKRLLDGMDVNTANEGGTTLLMLAASEGHLDVVDYLIRERGADVKRKTDRGGNVVTAAAKAGFGRTLSYILDVEGVDIDAIDSGMTALMLATQRGRLHMMENLIEKGANVDIVCSCAGPPFAGLTAREIAIEAGMTSAVWLLDRATGVDQTLDVTLKSAAGGIHLT